VRVQRHLHPAAGQNRAWINAVAMLIMMRRLEDLQRRRHLRLVAFRSAYAGQGGTACRHFSE
jgi:hypothetical protein